LLNLCLNARDAMPNGGTMTLATEPACLDGNAADFALPPPAAGPYVTLVVTDTGCGMEPEVLQRVFEPFFTTKEVGHGTGLGLAKAYGIVQQHGGAIRIRSVPGKGTDFRIYLPTA